MKAVQRWRYYCDHCKKSGGSKGHMLSHEQGCTLNPNRICKMCTQISGGQGDMLPSMLELLPDPEQFKKVIPASDYWPEQTELDDEAIKPLIAAALPALRELCENCPLCLMAAFRQKKIPVPMVEGFNYKTELAEMWSDIHDNRDERYY